MSQRSRQKLQRQSKPNQINLDPREPLEADLRRPMDAAFFLMIARADKQDYLMYLQKELGLDHIGIAEMLGIDRRKMYELMKELDVPLINVKNKGFNSPRQAQKLAEFRARERQVYPQFKVYDVVSDTRGLLGIFEREEETEVKKVAKEAERVVTEVATPETEPEQSELSKKIVIREFDEPIVKVTLEIKGWRKAIDNEIEALFERKLTGPGDVMEVRVKSLNEV